MFIKVDVNGINTKTLVDSRATNNFIVEKEAKNLVYPLYKGVRISKGCHIFIHSDPWSFGGIPIKIA